MYYMRIYSLYAIVEYFQIWLTKIKRSLSNLKFNTTSILSTPGRILYQENRYSRFYVLIV